MRAYVAVLSLCLCAVGGHGWLPAKHTMDTGGFGGGWSGGSMGKPPFGSPFSSESHADDGSASSSSSSSSEEHWAKRRTCPPGTFSRPSSGWQSDECLPCSECGDNLYVQRACTANSDTKCAVCGGRSVRYTQSYWDKCVMASDGRTAAVEDGGQATYKPKPAGSVNSVVIVQDQGTNNSNANELEQDEFTINVVGAIINHAGRKPTKPPTATTPAAKAAVAAAHQAHEQHSAKKGAHSEPAKAVAAHGHGHNAPAKVVAARPAGSELKASEPCKPCPPGYGQTAHCPQGAYWVGKTRDSVISEQVHNCAVCAPGTHSPAHTHYSACAPCAKCAAQQYAEHSCTSSSDTECKPCGGKVLRYTQSYFDQCVMMAKGGDNATAGKGKKRPDGVIAQQQNVANSNVNTQNQNININLTVHVKSPPKKAQGEQQDGEQGEEQDEFTVDGTLMDQQIGSPHREELEAKEFWWGNDKGVEVEDVKEASVTPPTYGYAHLVLRGLIYALFIAAICSLCLYLTRRCRKERTIYAPVLRGCGNDGVSHFIAKRPMGNSAFVDDDESVFENPLANHRYHDKGQPIV